MMIHRVTAMASTEKVALCVGAGVGATQTSGHEAFEIILDHILVWLQDVGQIFKCQGVCTAWRDVAMSTPLLWTTTRLPRVLRQRITVDAFDHILRCSQLGLKEMDLRGVAHVGLADAAIRGELLQGLVVLRLNSEEHAKSIPRALHMCHGFPTLQTLDLRACALVDDSIMALICRASCGATISKLNLRGCHITDEGVMIGVRYLASLKTLDIGSWPYSRHHRSDRLVTDVSLFFIAQCGVVKGKSFLLSSLCLAGRRAITDEGVEAATSLAANLSILDVRHCPQVDQRPPGEARLSRGGSRIGGLLRSVRGGDTIEVVCDSSCSGCITPSNYADEYGLDEASEVHSATGLLQLLQSIAAVRAAAELQATATAEAQAADMLVEAAEVQSRAAEIHGQAITMQAQAAEILARVAEVQTQVSSMQTQAEEQGHIEARAQAAEMQAQVAQMQVHAAQMQVHAAQMQIRATEMQGQAAEMQASALNIRSQAQNLHAVADGAGVGGEAEPQVGAAGGGGGGGGGGAVAAGAAAGAGGGLGSGGGGGGGPPGLAGDGGRRLAAVREETARLTQTVRDLTSRVERVTRREQEAREQLLAELAQQEANEGQEIAVGSAGAALDGEAAARADEEDFEAGAASGRVVYEGGEEDGAIGRARERGFTLGDARGTASGVGGLERMGARSGEASGGGGVGGSEANQDEDEDEDEEIRAIEEERMAVEAERARIEAERRAEERRLEEMREHNRRLIAQRNAEIESVNAVEARLAAVRGEQRRLAQTVADLRSRIEDLQVREQAAAAAAAANSTTEEGGGDGGAEMGAVDGDGAAGHVGVAGDRGIVDVAAGARRGQHGAVETREVVTGEIRSIMQTLAAPVVQQTGGEAVSTAQEVADAIRARTAILAEQGGDAQEIADGIRARTEVLAHVNAVAGSAIQGTEGDEESDLEMPSLLSEVIPEQEASGGISAEANELARLVGVQAVSAAAVVGDGGVEGAESQEDEDSDEELPRLVSEVPGSGP